MQKNRVLPGMPTRRAAIGNATLAMMSLTFLPPGLKGWTCPPNSHSRSQPEQSLKRLGPQSAAESSVTELDAPTFFDDFRAGDVDRWMRPDPDNWPPKPGTSGRWARHFFWGWPWSTSTSDMAARNLRASHEAQCYEDQGVKIGPEGLELIGTRSRSNRFRLPWTSGIVAQNPNLGITYGYFEMVAQLPAGPGLWPTFWLVGAGAAPEIDICEVLGNDTKVLHCSLHYLNTRGASVTVPDVSVTYHKYGLLWTSKDLTWYFDDKPVARRRTPPTASVPMYMLVNLAIGGVGSWPGPTGADTPSPAIMRVKSISSYKLGSWGGKPIPATPQVPG